MISLRKRFTAYVVFQGAEHRRWWRIFTRRGWRHVWVIIPAYYPAPSLTAVAYSQIINPWTDQIRSDVVFQNPKAVAEAALREGATCVIKLAVDQKFTGRYLPRGFLTCVSLVKGLLSIDAWHVWTPEQLARWMLQNGGKLLEIENDVIPIQPENAASGQEGGSRAAESAASAGSDAQQAIG